MKTPHQKEMLAELGRNLKRKRLALGLTLDTLADLSGVRKSVIYRIETGGNPTTTTLFAVCYSLGIHPSEILPTY